jgi:NAD(P)-dependent dehydrogenase (short-subunit alcohol dehydrogenase family)
MNQTALITGANRGLGLGLTKVFLDAGWRVIAGARQVSRELAELTAAFPERLACVALDVTSTESVRAASAEVRAQTGAIDTLINNAAILLQTERGTVETLDVDLCRAVFDVNALGPLRVTQAFLPLLKAGTGKLIVNVSSEAGSIGDCWRKDDVPYCMSKAALNLQTKILHNHLAPLGFRLMAVHPGWLRTDMGGSRADLDPNEAAQALYELIAARTPDAPLFVDYRGQALGF